MSHRRLFLVLSGLSSALVGCSAGDQQKLPVTLQEDVAQSSQALADDFWDRPVAAAVERVVNNQKQVWVFACGADHRMRRAVVSMDDYGNPIPPNRWITVANSFPCYSAPSIGKWAGGATESMGVYYRGGNSGDRLIEAWYDKDGSTRAEDLSNRQGLGPIVGAPAVVDAQDTPGMTQRMSIAVKRPNGQAYTFDLYWGDWHLQPITMPDGSIVTMTGNRFGASFGQYESNFLSLNRTGSEYAVFTRSTWKQGYSFYWSISDSRFRGVMTFGSAHPLCAPYGCITIRRWLGSGIPGDIFWWTLDPNADYFGTVAIEYGAEPSGTPYTAPTGNPKIAFAATTGGRMTLFRYPTGATGNQMGLPPAPSSAASKVMYASPDNSGGVYTTKVINSQWHRLIFMTDHNGFGLNGPTDLNYPDGVLVE